MARSEHAEQREMADVTVARAVGVRSAQPQDAPFITGLAGRLAEVSRLPWVPQDATDRFAASGCREAAAAIGKPGHAVVIASDNPDEPLGFAHVHLDQSAFTGETVGYVSVVVVASAAAGSGVGRRLMVAAEDWARQEGCALITLEVFATNAVARAVYERLGYREQTLKLAKRLATPPGDLAGDRWVGSGLEPPQCARDGAQD